jgi:hypothetical protein
VRYARGHAKNPIGLEELRDKFDDCVGAALDRTQSAALFERLAGLEKLSSATGLYS